MLPASWPVFSPMPFRLPVTEWHVLHLPTGPLKNASPAFGIAAENVVPLVILSRHRHRT